MSELVAFYLGLQFLEFIPPGKSVHILSDCKFVFTSLKLNKNSTELHQKCFNIINKYSSKLQINIDWISGNSPEEGLILADHLAKEARLLLPIDTRFLPSFACLKLHLRRHSFELWSSRYTTTTNSYNLKNFFPSLYHLNKILSTITMSQFNTAILSGHGLLRSHLFKHNLTDHPMCRFCYQHKEDITHLIFKCEKHILIREKLLNHLSTQFEIFPKNLIDFTYNHKNLNLLLSWLNTILKPNNSSNYPS